MGREASHEFPFLFPEFLDVLMPPCPSATCVLYASRSVVVVVPTVAAAKVRSSLSSPLQRVRDLRKFVGVVGVHSDCFVVLSVQCICELEI